MAATNFCEVYDCSTTGFFRIDRFSTEDQYTFDIIGGNTGYEGSMTYYLDYGWFGSCDDAELFPGHGIRIDTDGDGVYDTDGYQLSYSATTLEDQEFCHPGLGCTGFGNGTGIILPHRDMNDPLVAIKVTIPIPVQISEDGDPIYSEDQINADPGGEDPECFVAGTKVKMSNGLEKNIEDIKIGEQVLSYNIHTKKIESKKVTKLYTQVHDLVDGDITVKTKFNNGVETHNTIANPFWSKDKGFVAADAERCNRLHQWVKQTNKGKDTEQLKVGDTLYHYNGKELQEVMVTEIEHIVEPYIRTYDITVEDNHTFFANGILTHNSSGGGGDSDDDEIGTYIYGCFDPYADNYYCDQEGVDCVNGCPPDADQCIDNGSCTYGGTDTTYSDIPKLFCCQPNTQDGTVRYSGEFPFSDVESVVNLNELYYGDNELNIGNVFNTQACNQIDCNVQELDDDGNLIPKVHFDGQCVNSMGTHGKFGHNIVFDYYYDTVFRKFDFDDESGEGDIPNPSLYHYPFVKSRQAFDGDSERSANEYVSNSIHSENLDYSTTKYFAPFGNANVSDLDWELYDDVINDGEGEFGPTTDEYDNGVFNPVFDRWQVGIDEEGNELYNLPIYRELTCDEVENINNINTDQYTGTRADVELGIGFTKSPFSSGTSGDYDDETYKINDSHVNGIDYCGGSDLVDEAFNRFFSNPLYFRVLINIFAQHPSDIWFQNIDEDHQIPNSTIGFGLNSSGVSEIIVTENAEEYIRDEFSLESNQNLNRDVLIRIGFPLPPISFNGLNCEGVRDSYLKLVDEFIGELEQLTFFEDFGVGDINIEPSMKNTLDVLSGIDLREDELNACSHMEFMTLPGGNTDGDGIYYKGSDLPNEYFQYSQNNVNEEYIKNFNCGTNFTINLRFSRLRATCKDGSTIMVGDAGDNTDTTIEVNNTDKIFNNGIEACNSLLKLNSSQDLYYLADNDGKESLGIFFFDNENQLSENFINDKDESFEQYDLSNGIINGAGRDVEYMYQHSSWNEKGWGNIYEAKNWTLINSQDLHYTDNYTTSDIAPYWRANYSECFSYNKCIVVDTLKPIQESDFNYDPRQGITTRAFRDDLSETALRRKQKFKLSFMMKTIELNDGVELKNTGISTALEFTNNDSYPSISDTEEGFKAKQYKTSQCSPIGKNPNHFSSVLTEERYCNQPRASFTNTKMNEWQKMEYVFEVDKDINFDIFKYIKIIISPLEYAKFDHNFYYSSSEFTLYDTMSQNSSIILVDNVEFKEAFDFHPDVDVRKKKGPNDFGLVSLMEYYDRFKQTANIEEFNDTTAPLEVQFYFYPRFPYDDTLSPNREILLEEFEFKQFYISDVDWGDGSPIEFDTDPKRIGTNIALYHTYEQSGIYEIKGTMFTIVSEDYNFSLNPNEVEYVGNSGVGYNKKFRVKININEGLDEDFTYFGTDGFSFIPYKETTPVIGGHSKESIYYKSIKRNLGIIDSNNGVELVDVNYSRTSDRLKAESAFQKMDSSYNDSGAFNILNYYQQPINITENTDLSYVSTLPYPRYFQEFDILNQNNFDYETISAWHDVGRPDIAEEVDINLQAEELTMPILSESDTYNPPSVYINPRMKSQTEQYTGEQYKTYIEQLGESIGDVDLSNPKYFNKPKTMSELLGFPNVDSTIDISTFFGFVGVADSPIDTSIDDPALNKTIEWRGIGCVSGNNYQDFYEQVSDFGYYPYTDGFYETECARAQTNNNFHHDINMDEPTEQGIERATHACAKVFGGEPYNYNAVLASVQQFELNDEDIEYYDWYNFHAGSQLVQYHLYGCQVENINIENPYNPNSPDSQVYWKNIIPQDYSIFNRQGIVKSENGEFEMPQKDIENEGPNQTQNQQQWKYDGLNVDYCDGEPDGNCKWENFFDIQYFSDDRYGMAVAAESSAMIWTGDRWAGTSTNNVLDLTAENYYFEMLDLDGDGFNETQGGLFAKCQIQGPDDDGPLVEFCHPALGCTNFGNGTGITLPRGGSCTHEILPQDCATACIHTSELGASYGIPPTQGGATCFNPIIDARLYGAIGYHYPVLPRHGNDGKYLEDDYPFDYIPSPLEANIYNEEQSNENLLINISSEGSDTNTFNDNSGQSNKGFTINDYKPKFDNETLEIKKTKTMNTIKKSNKNRAF